MSNTYKIIAAVLALLIIGATSIFLIGQNGLEIKTLISSSSSSVSTIKSQEVSSLRSSQIVSTSSSVSATVNSITLQISSSVKAESQVVVSKTTKCNLLESENLVKTDQGCFELIFSIADSEIFKSKEYPENVNSNLLFKNETNVNFIKEAAKDYYKRVSSKFISKKHSIFVSNTKKMAEHNFSISFSMVDEDYIKINPKVNVGAMLTRYNANYILTLINHNEDINNKNWYFQFQFYLPDSNGNIINV